MVPGIVCIDINDEEEENNVLTCIHNRYSNERVVIVTNLTSDHDAPELIKIGDDHLELRYVGSIYNIHGNGLYKAEVYSRHGSTFKKWWYQHRNQKHSTCSDNEPGMNKKNHTYTVAYVKLYNFDEQSNKRKLLKLLGGQCHVICATHDLPLVRSRGHLQCSTCKKRQDYLCCSVSSCQCNICKKCFDTINEEEIYFQHESRDEEASTSDGSFSSDDSSRSDSCHAPS